MPLLTRPEELVLLAIWKLQGEAYSIPIREYISNMTGDDWSLGSIYMPLDRLGKRGLIESYLSESTPERGGRHKRMYKMTPEGMKELIRLRELQTAMWTDISNLKPEL